jgi:hypothetical protein
MTTRPRLNTYPRFRHLEGLHCVLLYQCQRRLNYGSGTLSVTFLGGLVGEEDAESEQVGVRASVHLPFEHLCSYVESSVVGLNRWYVHGSGG